MLARDPSGDASSTSRAETDDPGRLPGSSAHGPKELIGPFALLLLADSPGHGYALATRLRRFGFDWGGPGPLYGHLRDLERQSLVTSSLSPGEAGPSRRTYALTSVGAASLRSLNTSVQALRQALVLLLSELSGAPAHGVHVAGVSGPCPPADTVTGVTELRVTRRALPPEQRQKGSVPDTGEIGYPREMVLAGILSIVAKAPTNSAGVISRLGAIGMAWDGAGPVYVHLHSLTAACLLTWNSPLGRGGRRGRRVYHLSPAGRLVMPAWTEYLQQFYMKLAGWSREYSRLSIALDRGLEA